MRGAIYADFFARAGKRQGAWQGDLRRPRGGAAAADYVNCGVAAILCEAAAPCAPDLVEAPALLLEALAAAPPFLAGFARHFASGGPAPRGLLPRAALGARALMAQLFFYPVDLALHHERAALPPDAVEAAAAAAYGRPPVARLRSCGRLVTAPAAFAGALYGAAWAEAVAADLAAAVAADFEAGAALCRAALRTAFAAAARPPPTDALLVRRGLRPAEGKISKK
jgi:Zn-dependent oligopeptidase